jgi:hypothetical protein
MSQSEALRLIHIGVVNRHPIAFGCKAKRGIDFSFKCEAPVKNERQIEREIKKWIIPLSSNT